MTTNEGTAQAGTQRPEPVGLEHGTWKVLPDRLEPAERGAFTVPATIEIRGRVEQVDMKLHTHRSSQEEDGRPDRVRIHLHGVIDRHDFGIKATPPAEWVVASDVHIDSDLLLERVA